MTAAAENIRLSTLGDLRYHAQCFAVEIAALKKLPASAAAAAQITDMEARATVLAVQISALEKPLTK